VAADELIEAVWGGAAVTDDSIVQCLVTSEGRSSPIEVIRTVRGKGYRFDADVRAADAGADAYGRFDPSGTQVPSPAPDAAPSRPERARSRWPLVAAGVALLSALGIWALTMRDPGATAAPAPAPGGEAPVAPQVTLNTAVVQLMVAGNEALLSRSQADLQRARSAFEAAVKADPRYAPARAALSNTLTLFAVFGLERPSAVLPPALAEARHAVELDPTYAFAWSALAHTQVHWSRDWAAAEANYRPALALNPKAEMPSFLLAHLLMGIGRSTEAMAQSLKALHLDPRSPRLQGSTGIVHYFTGKAVESLPYFQRALELDPRYSTAAFWQGVALASLGRLDEAMDAALRSRADMGNTPTWLVGYVHATAGRTAEAREVLRAMEAHATRRYVPAIEFAYLHLALGDREAALSWLERALEEHSRWIELIAVDPILDPLRGERRFEALLDALRPPRVS
jgi:tetratricopeptide (TPR) repeat protein